MRTNLEYLFMITILAHLERVESIRVFYSVYYKTQIVFLFGLFPFKQCRIEFIG